MVNFCKNIVNVKPFLSSGREPLWLTFVGWSVGWSVEIFVGCGNLKVVLGSKTLQMTSEGLVDGF